MHFRRRLEVRQAVLPARRGSGARDRPKGGLPLPRNRRDCFQGATATERFLPVIPTTCRYRRLRRVPHGFGDFTVRQREPLPVVAAQHLHTGLAAIAANQAAATAPCGRGPEPPRRTRGHRRKSAAATAPLWSPAQVTGARCLQLAGAATRGAVGWPDSPRIGSVKHPAPEGRIAGRHSWKA